LIQDQLAKAHEGSNPSTRTMSDAIVIAYNAEYYCCDFDFETTDHGKWFVLGDDVLSGEYRVFPNGNFYGATEPTIIEVNKT
jgi:hypothetical protein